MSMQPIGEVLRGMNIQDKIRGFEAKAHEHRAAMMRQYGEDFDVNKCYACGGRGRVPGSGQICRKCDAGLKLAGLDDHERKWGVLVPVMLRDYRCSTHPNQREAERVAGWANGPSKVGKNLYLGGSIGTGKTGLAIGALRMAHDSGRSILYGTAPDILDRLRPGPGDDAHDVITVEKLQNVDLLLIDDAGAEKPTEWTTEQWYQIFNARYVRHLPTIVTTNLTPREFEQRVGSRVVSRFLQNVMMVALDGEDLRRKGRG